MDKFLSIQLQQLGNRCIKSGLIYYVYIFFTDRASEAIRELEVIKEKPDVLLCATMALIHAHKKAKLVDREAVQELETKLRQDRQSCGEMALYFGSMFLWHTGRHDKAREYVDRMLKMATGNKEVKINK